MVGREPAGEEDVGREWEEADGGTWMLSGRLETCKLEPCRARGRDRGGDEGEDGESEGSVESRDRWDWIQDGEEAKNRKRLRLWTAIDHGAEGGVTVGGAQG